MSANPAIIRLFKRQSQTSLPPSTCSEHFSCAPQSPQSIFVDALCAHTLTSHILTIDWPQRPGQRIHKTRVLQGVSRSNGQDELERLSGFWFRVGVTFSNGFSSFSDAIKTASA
jgi:hypothetical protein